MATWPPPSNRTGPAIIDGRDFSVELLLESSTCSPFWEPTIDFVTEIRVECKSSWLLRWLLLDRASNPRPAIEPATTQSCCWIRQVGNKKTGQQDRANSSCWSVDWVPSWRRPEPISKPSWPFFPPILPIRPILLQVRIRRWEERIRHLFPSSVISLVVYDCDVMVSRPIKKSISYHNSSRIDLYRYIGSIPLLTLLVQQWKLCRAALFPLQIVGYTAERLSWNQNQPTMLSYVGPHFQFSK